MISVNAEYPQQINFSNFGKGNLFKKSNQYEQYKDDLANFKMDLYREFLSNENNDPNEKIKLENKLKGQKQLNEESVGSNSWKLFSPARRLKKFLKK